MPPRVFEDGGQRRDFVHVRDVARANLLALRRGRRGAAGDGSLRCYNVASGEPHTVARWLWRWLGAVRRHVEPVVTGEYRLGDVRHIVASPEGAARDLGFRAQTPVRFGHRRVRPGSAARARPGPGLAAGFGSAVSAAVPAGLAGGDGAGVGGACGGRACRGWACWCRAY